MIKNGIYSLTALAIDGAGVDAGGVLILHDGKIYGGDSFVYYVGTYNCSDGKWTGEIVSQEHTPTTRPIAERVQSIKLAAPITMMAPKSRLSPWLENNPCNTTRYCACWRQVR
jgi:T3SS negative regulator,GrlR